MTAGFRAFGALLAAVVLAALMTFPPATASAPRMAAPALTTTDPEPTDPEPTDPEPTDPEPTDPDGSNPDRSRGPLGLNPDRSVVPRLVTATPCGYRSGDGGEFALVLDGRQSLLDEDGRPALYIPGQPTSFLMPAGTSPGTHTVDTVNTFSGDTITLCDTAFFTVLAAPTLVIDPPQAPVSEEVMVSGTCPSRIESGMVQVALDDEVVAEDAIRATSEFGPRSFTVPDETTPGEHVLTTDCDGIAYLQVLPPSAGPTTPGPGQGSPGGGGENDPQSNVPAPPVTPGPSQPPPRNMNWGSPLLSVVALLAVVAIAATAVPGLRRRAGRRWLDRHVQVRPGGAEALVAEPELEQHPRAQTVWLRAHPAREWVVRRGGRGADR